MANTYGDLVTDALAKIRMARAGDVPNPNDMAFGMRALNRLIDGWNAERPRVYREFFQDFTLTPSLDPHTIGPTGATFTVTGTRPVSIDAAGLNIGGSPATYQRITVYDWRYYASRAQPGLSTALPFALYYDPAYTNGNGNCYFWPVPTSALGVRLWMRQVLASVAQTDNVTLPQGYEIALLWSLARFFSSDFGQAWPADNERQYTQAIAAIEGNNDVVPTIATRDSGMQPASVNTCMTNSEFLSRGPY